MKKKILALCLILALLLSLVIPVSAEETAVSVNTVTAGVGDTVTLAVSVSGAAAIQTGSVALAFDETALELVSGGWVLPNNPMLVNFDMTKGQGVGAFSYMMTSSALDGVVFEAQFKVLDAAAQSNSVDFTVLLQDANKITVANTVVRGCIVTATEAPASLSVTDASASVGDVITLSLSTAELSDIQAGSVALAFDETAFELVSGGWVLPNNPMLANFDMTKGQGVGAFSYMMTSSALDGVVFEAQLRVLSGAADVNEVAFTVTMNNSAKESVVDGETVVGCVNVETSPRADVCISDKISVFEMEARFVDGDASRTIVTLGKGDTSRSFLESTAARELTVKIGDVSYFLCDEAANRLLLDEATATDIALIYDDVNGTLRCYVDGTVAYYCTETGVPVLVNALEINDPTFVTASGDESVTVGQGVVLTNAYNVCDSGTAEFVGFQVNTDSSTSIRLLAGLDMLYYSTVGFKVELYSGGILQGAVDRDTDVVFSGITANGSVVTAESKGYRYLTAVSIVGIDRTYYPADADVYFLVTTYTTVGGVKTCAATAKITVARDAVSGEHIYTVDGAYAAE